MTKVYLVLSAPARKEVTPETAKVFGPYDEVIISEMQTVFGVSGRQTPDEADSFTLFGRTAYWDGDYFRVVEITSVENWPEAVPELYDRERATIPKAVIPAQADS